jgi:hypothetical protein
MGKASIKANCSGRTGWLYGNDFVLEFEHSTPGVFCGAVRAVPLATSTTIENYSLGAGYLVGIVAFGYESACLDADCESRPNGKFFWIPSR